MKRIEWFKIMTSRQLANEFYYFDISDFIDKNDNYEKVIKKIMHWLNEERSNNEIT